MRDGKPVTGYGFASVGRFAQGGLMRERFIPRLMNAPQAAVADEAGTNIDPFKAWSVMMQGEKPGGHGERCVAVGTLDMALWDAAAKIANQPLHRFLAARFGQAGGTPARIPVYAGGGYLYPSNDIARLADEIRQFRDLGYTRAKIKIGSRGSGSGPAADRCGRGNSSGPDHLAVDAMNLYADPSALRAAAALAPLGLWWFEDICDPLDFALSARVADAYAPPIAAGEALFSCAEARLLHQYGGLRADRDILVFDPVHCYGLPGFLQIVRYLEAAGWNRKAFWPHGGHLFALHVVAALGLGGAEVNPLAFQPFRGLPEGANIVDGLAPLPDAPGIGFETHSEARHAFRTLLHN